jgi:arylsulfatase A-like enzyme
MSTHSQPDVVLVHCHDLGRWLSVYGMPHVPSENIDRFARESVVFDNAHSAAPLCSPARGALFTGMSPVRNGLQGLAHNGWRYRAGVQTLPERLRPLGYRSTLVGLQHENVDPRVLGFDECVGLGFLPRVNQVVHATENWLAALPAHADRQPVFLTVGVWEVHRPWPAEDYEHADPATVDVPAFLPDNDHTRSDIAAFYGSIQQFDEGFGRLMAAIDSTFDRESTMVILTTDHGAAFPRGKSTLYDAGTGVTLIVRPPAAWGAPPQRVRGLVSHLDIVPTLVDLAGAAPDPQLEGRSLLPVLHGSGSIEAERVIFTAKDQHDVEDPKRAVRSLSYLYVRNYAEGPRLQLPIDLEESSTRRGMDDAHLAPRPAEELYDLQSDPDEKTNLAGDPAYEAVRSEYADRLQAWLARIHDPIETQRIRLPAARSREIDALEPFPPLTPAG